MKAIILEGTPEEIRAALPSLDQSASALILASAASKPTAKALPVGDEDEEDFEVSYIEKQTARRYLNRRKLHDSQRTVFQTLAAAHPEMVTAPTLQEKLKITTAQFAGVMGALGRRLTHTPGWVDGDCLFVQDWDTENGYYKYGLPESVMAALKLEKVI